MQITEAVRLVLQLAQQFFHIQRILAALGWGSVGRSRGASRCVVDGAGLVFTEWLAQTRRRNILLAHGINPGVGLVGSCRAYQQVQAGGGAAVLVTGGLYLQLAQMRPQYVNRTSQPVGDQLLPALAARAVGG